METRPFFNSLNVGGRNYHRNSEILTDMTGRIKD